jgi:hypothetical protein
MTKAEYEAKEIFNNKLKALLIEEFTEGSVEQEVSKKVFEFVKRIEKRKPEVTNKALNQDLRNIINSISNLSTNFKRELIAKDRGEKIDVKNWKKDFTFMIDANGNPTYSITKKSKEPVVEKPKRKTRKK